MGMFYKLDNAGRELVIPNDWARINNYRCFVFTDPRLPVNAAFAESKI